jgi:sec-independent protein translocase protein TatB
MDSFFGIGIFELIIIAIIALVVMGPERLPGAMREVSKYARMVRNLSSELQSQFGEELQMLDEMNPKRIVNDVLNPAAPAQGTTKPARAKPTPVPGAPVIAASAAAAALPAETAVPTIATEPAADPAAGNSILPPAPVDPPAASPSSPPVEEGR